MKFLLVGTFSIPGAAAIISKGLAQYAAVLLRAEPENPYDAEAVRVLVARDEVIRTAELEEALVSYGLGFGGLQFPFAIGHLGAKYSTKAAQAALREGHQFRLVQDWHGVGAQSGRLIQHPDGTKLVEVG
jgi:hypothetical protein